ncbi:MAG: ImmA/IrrE family metallo-endopeptidase [Ignavibacteriaceae bacterium]
MTKKNEYFPQSIPHPGLDLNEKLEELGMGPKEFAVRADKPEKTITAILNGESSITPDMAVQFENVLKIPAHFWINRQRSFDEYLARIKREKVIAEAIPWSRNFPIGDMVKKGWLPKVISAIEKTSAVLSFFALSNHTAWEDYYMKGKLKVGFRISLVHSKNPYSISAWLRKGELQASVINSIDYSEKAFKAALPQLKEIMAKHPSDYFTKLQSICLKAGVKVVYTPCLPGSPISGATRWLNDKPLIQLSGRFKRNDIFWFTFFHEAGHILLHGKKDIFLENVKYNEFDKGKENEADDFAVKCTLTIEQEQEILQIAHLNHAEVIMYAEKFGTHPGIIIGRLHHLKKLPPSVGRKFIIPIDLENA